MPTQLLRTAHTNQCWKLSNFKYFRSSYITLVAKMIKPMKKKKIIAPNAKKPIAPMTRNDDLRDASLYLIYN